MACKSCEEARRAAREAARALGRGDVSAAGQSAADVARAVGQKAIDEAARVRSLLAGGGR